MPLVSWLFSLFDRIDLAVRGWFDSIPHPGWTGRVNVARDGWFWSEEWQQAERRADADVQSGQYVDFRDPEEAARALIEHGTDPVMAALRRRGP